LANDKESSFFSIISANLYIADNSSLPNLSLSLNPALLFFKSPNSFFLASTERTSDNPEYKAACVASFAWMAALFNFVSPTL
tara:strand:- start:473 stop:718 length:246 start_codon:yes stop_codon:yes gene_type:complete